MTFDNLSDYDLLLINELLNEFHYGLLSYTDFEKSFFYKREYLENIVRKSCINLPSDLNIEGKEDFKDSGLECDLIHNQWWAFDPRYVGGLDVDEVKAVISSLGQIIQRFDGDISALIADIDELKALKLKLESLLVIKDFMCLQWSEFKYYRDVDDCGSFLNLKYLIYFFSNDYRPNNDYRVYDRDLLIRNESSYDGVFVYNDIENKMLYIGIAEWEFDEDIKSPNLEEFSNYVNEMNSCKISHDNFIELTEKMLKLKKNPAPFAVVYRDNSDWIRCKGFSSKDDLKQFPENY